MSELSEAFASAVSYTMTSFIAEEPYVLLSALPRLRVYYGPGRPCLAARDREDARRAEEAAQRESERCPTCEFHPDDYDYGY